MKEELSEEIEKAKVIIEKTLLELTDKTGLAITNIDTDCSIDISGKVLKYYIDFRFKK